jgi:hypothetical protein
MGPDWPPSLLDSLPDCYLTYPLQRRKYTGCCARGRRRSLRVRLGIDRAASAQAHLGKPRGPEAFSSKARPGLMACS